MCDQKPSKFFYVYLALIDLPITHLQPIPPKCRHKTVLEFRGVSLQKGEYRILDQIDWKVKQGQIWAVKGLNGSGKSTATKLLMVCSPLC